MVFGRFVDERQRDVLFRPCLRRRRSRALGTATSVSFDLWPPNYSRGVVPRRIAAFWRETSWPHRCLYGISRHPAAGSVGRDVPVPGRTRPLS